MHLLKEVAFHGLEQFFRLKKHANLREQSVLYLAICNLANFWNFGFKLSLVKVTGSF